MRNESEHEMYPGVLADRAIRETMIERGVKLPAAREIVAREIGVQPGTLTRLINKSLVHHERVADRIKAYVVRRLEAQIARLEHDLAIARLAAQREEDQDIFRAQEALDEAKRALGR